MSGGELSTWPPPAYLVTCGGRKQTRRAGSAGGCTSGVEGGEEETDVGSEDDGRLGDAVLEGWREEVEASATLTTI